MTDDRLTAALDEIRKRWDVFGEGDATPRLLGAVERVLELAAKAEHGALRWEDPLPVPEWAPRVRETITAALLGEETA